MKILNCPFCNSTQNYTIKLAALRGSQGLPVEWCNSCVDDYFDERNKITKQLNIETENKIKLIQEMYAKGSK